MTTIPLEQLRRKLLSVQPGLSEREVIEQSSCFAFTGGRVITYNDEVTCSQELELGFEGAVQAKTLLAILEKLPDAELSIEVAKRQVILRGKGRTCKFRREQKILLPIANLEQPADWRKLPKGFVSALSMVQYCATSNQTQWKLTCIHVTPGFMEACDNFQALRVTMDTGFKSAVLIKRDALQHIISLDVKEISETKSWVHFRNKEGLVLSCRRYLDGYQSLDAFFVCKGPKIKLPQKLAEAATRAGVFSVESLNDNVVGVALTKSKIIVRGKGATGAYREGVAIEYIGDDVEFIISPILLADVVKRYPLVRMSSTRLKASGTDEKFQFPWEYVTCLTAPKTTKEEVDGEVEETES